jgi:hypothetical protein
MTNSDIAAIIDSEQPQGHLVSQILGTKSKLETSEQEAALEADHV